MVHVELTNYRMSIIYSNAKGNFKTHTIFRVQGQAIIFHSIIENNELLTLSTLDSALSFLTRP